MATTIATPLTRTRWSSDEDADRFVVDNPAYGTPITAVQGANPAQVDAAVRAAHVATAFTRDSERSLRVGRAIEVGIVFINGFSRNIFGLPFGGTKHSGYGREIAAETLREFGYAQTLRLRTGIGTIPRWFAVDDVLSDSSKTTVIGRTDSSLIV
jgi:acyl-CoA reductase-like NAD-dependent aldehyde dehydrogenase